MPHRILIADTEHQALAGDQAILADLGYLVTRTTSFSEAKRRLLLAPPDLLMANVRLGEYNGLHLVHRGHVSDPGMPAIVIDEVSDQALKEEARRADAAYLIKPVDPTTLVNTVRGLLAGRPVDASTQASRRWARKGAEMAAMLDETHVKVLDLSYGGLRLAFEGDRLNHAHQINVPRLGSIPVRLVWAKNGGLDRGGWCGLEIVAGERQVADAWHNYVDSLPDREVTAP